MNKNPESDYDITLLLAGIVTITPEVEHALFTAGCDDSTLSARLGRLYLTFLRSAATLKDAIVSAIQDVRRSGNSARVLRVDQSDLVTQVDIARRIDRSRQLASQYIGAREAAAAYRRRCATSPTERLFGAGAT